MNLLVRVHWSCFLVSSCAAVDGAVEEDSPAWSNLQYTQTRTQTHTVSTLPLVAVMQCENSSRAVLTKPLNPYKTNISVERCNYYGQMRPLPKNGSLCWPLHGILHCASLGWIALQPQTVIVELRMLEQVHSKWTQSSKHSWPSNHQAKTLCHIHIYIYIISTLRKYFSKMS